MMRITFYIFVIMACFVCKPMESYAQEMRDITPNSIRPPANQKLRIPDQFFRHDQVRDKVRDKDILSYRLLEKKFRKIIPDELWMSGSLSLNEKGLIIFMM